MVPAPANVSSGLGVELFCVVGISLECHSYFGYGMNMSANYFKAG